MNLSSLDAQKVNALIEINAQISAKYPDLYALMVCFLESSMRLLGCESSSLILVNESDNQLHFEVALGPKGTEVLSIPVSMESIAGWVYEHRESVLSNDVPNDPRWYNKVQDKTGYATRNMIAVPMVVEDDCLGVIEVLNTEDPDGFSPADLEVLELLTLMASVSYRNASLYNQARDKIADLQGALDADTGDKSFIASNPAMLDLLMVGEQVAKTYAPILILGEVGVGKRLFAERLHTTSSRAGMPFIVFSCTSLSANVLENTVFCEGDATPSSLADLEHAIALAQGGTLFLNEISGLPLAAQDRIIGLLEETPALGGDGSPFPATNVRIIASTKHDLEALVQEGTFRSALYYRLGTLPLTVPPLRERKDEIESLAMYFLHTFSAASGKSFTGFSPEALDLLTSYCWPENVRELEEAVGHACVSGQPPYIQKDDITLKTSKTGFPVSLEDGAGDDRTLAAAVNRFKKAYVTKILMETAWNQTEASKILGVQRTYVSRLLNELEIRKKRGL